MESSKRCSACGRAPFNPDVLCGTPCGAMLASGAICPGKMLMLPPVPA